MGFTEKSAKEALEDYILGRPVTAKIRKRRFGNW